MNELVLNTEEVKALISYCGEIPGKYGNPILQFIDAVGKRNSLVNSTKEVEKGSETVTVEAE